jgi:hypothetical protein
MGIRNMGVCVGVKDGEGKGEFGGVGGMGIRGIEWV